MMAGQVRRGLALALAGLVGGLGLVLALFGGGDALRRIAVREETAALPPGAPPPDTGFRTLAGPDAGADAGSGREARRDAAPGAGPAAEPGAGPKVAPAPEAPSFDIVRVEPNGDAVVAGRGAPNTVVEMLVDGRPVAKALADPNGQFAIVPPALPAGASEIQLRAKGSDGREARSAQSVAVDLAPGRDRRPLVALTAPDRATVVLSEPGAPEAAQAAGGQAGGRGSGQAGGPGTGAGAKAASADGAARPTRIASVDAQEGGRLHVTATGTPGQSVRLYLNDTLIAPGSVGPDGRVTFTIGRGIAPGQYRVRVDRVEPGSGKVRERAEVPFSVPEPAQAAAQAAAQVPARAAAGDAAPPRADGAPGGGTAVAAAAPQAARGRTAQAEAGRGGKAAPDRADAPGARAADAGSPAPGAGAGVTPTGMAGSRADGPAAVFVPEVGTARIARGDNLWRISQRAYGRGERYTVIYGANQDQIRNPDLIYPGQTFVLPVDKRG